MGCRPWDQAHAGSRGRAQPLTVPYCPLIVPGCPLQSVSRCWLNFGRPKGFSFLRLATFFELTLCMRSASSSHTVRLQRACARGSSCTGVANVCQRRSFFFRFYYPPTGQSGEYFRWKEITWHPIRPGAMLEASNKRNAKDKRNTKGILARMWAGSGGPVSHCLFSSGPVSKTTHRCS